ncbi:MULTISPECIES: 5-formyltetrahydrofolate cyclo-ligase [Peptoniphilus]|uniref:5-formyltetrahydrofolate cyclo-ligase n=1 Tax=Peptoniphilus TaxID=162289 RepID=UPI0001DA9D59|nr:MULTISPECIES: 5-formyltetrahydrofolate cyclo-ligase [Peptoniphilus]EFI42497.1 5-formyltetrahydrofolate cyclo-ligase [Peptoniphilus sp. oral taxon 386 str. F0131]
MNKIEFRKLMSKKRNELSEDYIENSSEKIYENFINSDIYKKSNHIFIFVSYKKEVNTHKIIKKALKDEKNVYIPVIDRNTMTMNVSCLRDFDSLKENYMGILEPTEKDLNFVDPKIIDLVIVPGLAFDKNGYRIGYGGGFYDKFFATIETKPIKLGIGYSMQFVDEVIHDDFDKALDYFLSENQIYKLGGF